MARIILVSAGEEAPEHESTVVLARYASGETLVSTEAPGVESARGVTPSAGLVLSDVGPELIDEARIAVFEEDTAEFLAYVVLAGPVAEHWLDALRETGLTLLRFQPHSAYLSRGNGPQFAEANELPFVTSVVRLDERLKPRDKTDETGDTPVWIVVDGSADVSALRRHLEGLDDCEVDGPVERTNSYVRFPALTTETSVAAVLRHPFVLAVELRNPVVPEDELAGLVLSGNYTTQGRPNGRYLEWLEEHGINGRNVCIGIVDNGVDETHEAFSTRITSKDAGRRWHGTFVAGHAAGCYLAERDGDGFIYGLGMAPAAELISQNNQNSASFSCNETVTTAGPGGAYGTIQNNSWGVGTSSPMDYRSLEAQFDELVRDASTANTRKPLTVCFSAGNSGTSGLTRPKAAKNVIVTGNSEIYRPSVGGSDSDDIDDVYTGAHASSHGNCGDGRIRPHVIAPGEWTASANFDSHPGQPEYISPKLTWGGGTSGASPKTAGACALLTQWWRSHNAGATPSPALLRAMVVNSAEDTRFGGPIPNAQQGWGRLNLANALSRHVHHLYVDQSIMLRGRGEERTWRIRVSDRTKPLRVTLAWTDPPGGLNTGTSSTPAVVNFLGLRVETSGQTYHGNKFANGMSVAGALADPNREGWDNLQNVYLAAGSYGTTATIKVRALNITSDCLGSSSGNPQQDFALVITNGYLDSNACPTDMFIVIDDVSGGSGSSVDDYWDSGSQGDDEDDARWWADIDAQDRPTLRQGTHGDPVTVLQRLLADLGYLDGEVDGVFGAGTARAVAAFQQAAGLAADGVAGALTWQALYEAARAGGPSPGASNGGGTSTGSGTPAATGSGAGSDRPTLRQGNRGDDVFELQRLLIATGYLGDEGRDGAFGAGTQDAVVRFQRDEGLSIDGVVGAGTWAALYDAAGESSSLHDTAPTGGTEDDFWDDDFWDDDGDTWWEESHRPASETERRADEGAASALGRSMLVARPHEGRGVRMFTAGGAATESGASLHVDDVEDADDEIVDRARAQAIVPLRQALEALMDRWDAFGASEDDGLMRRRVAVVAVGARTRVSRWDLQAMRRLGLHGDLYIVSAEGNILQFLAQRLHLTRGVHIRRAAIGNVDETVRQVAIEATGAHSLVVHAESKEAEGLTLHRFGFHLSELDHRAVLVVRGDPEAQFQVKPPDGEPFPVNTRTRRVRLSTEGDEVRIEFGQRGDDKPWTGLWTVLARGAQPITNEAWVWSDLELQLRENEVVSRETSRESETSVVTLRGSDGAKLGRMQVSRRDVTDNSERPLAPLQISVRRSRLAREAGGVLPETGGVAAAPVADALDARVSLAAEDEARVLDVHIEATGVTPEGARFERGVRGNLMRLVPRRRWRRNRHRSPVVREEEVAARVVAIRYSQAGAITGLLIERADRGRRRVRVEDPVLRELLADADLDRGVLLFRLDGDVLVSVVRTLPGGDG